MVKVKSEILYFLVNTSPPKWLDVATSNFAGALASSKAGMVYHRLKSSLILISPLSRSSIWQVEI